jgi:uncharacterized damage-inducible protein DinB
MPMNEALITELDQIAKSTRKLLERVPVEKNDWKPHDKSMTLGRLAGHIAEIPSWVSATIDLDELDFSKMEYKPFVAASTEELVKKLDENAAKGLESLKNATDEKLNGNWTLRNGEQIYFTRPKIGVVRDFAYSHLYHHRGQLTVYLRLLDIPLPMLFGPTADEQM